MPRGPRGAAAVLPRDAPPLGAPGHARTSAELPGSNPRVSASRRACHSRAAASTSWPRRRRSAEHNGAFLGRRPVMRQLLARTAILPSQVAPPGAARISETTFERLRAFEISAGSQEQPDSFDYPPRGEKCHLRPKGPRKRSQLRHSTARLQELRQSSIRWTPGRVPRRAPERLPRSIRPTTPASSHSATRRSGSARRITRMTIDASARVSSGKTIR